MERSLPDALTKRPAVRRTSMSTRRALLASLGFAPGNGLPWPSFPLLDPERAREVVGAAHRDLARVKAVVEEFPAAVNAAIDWGFGDFETALGAAAHTGRREIAEYLLDRGARLDLFAAAMLGMTEVVKAMVAARPGVESAPGPHGIPLLAHARAGGEKARPTLAYLETLPGAAQGFPVVDLRAERRAACAGQFRRPDGGPRIEIRLASPSQLTLVTGGLSPRPLHHAGNEEFYPAGAYAVRLRFTAEGLVLRHGNQTVSAKRE